MNRLVIVFFALIGACTLVAQPWQQDNSLFNPSGIPSLTFSQPRFADLDGDGDRDFLLGNTNRSPIFIRNNGTAAVPAFVIGEDITSNISSLAAEMGVCADMDADGDLDLVTGGYTGLHLFTNTGTAQNPVYAEVNGYFSALNVGSNPVPDLADVDNDGDYDMIVGLSEDGGVRLYPNIGSAVSGQFGEAAMQVIGDVGLYAYPVFCDLDADNDVDILVGRDLHGFVYYQNNGSPSVANWQENSALFAGLGQEDYWNSPDLVDLNNDGLFDLVFGTASGPLQYYVNAGTASLPVWQQNNTLFGGVIDVGGASSPVFMDFDADGDLDMLSGSQLGDIKYFENIGSLHAPAWDENNGMFTSIDHSIYSAVTAGDVNGDNLTDLIVGDLNGSLYFHRNTGLGFVEEAGVLPVISLGGWSVPRLLDIDFDGDLDLITGNEAGNMRFYENQGTAVAPNWVLINNYFGAIDVGSNCVPSFGDVDGDGDYDFVTGDMWGEVQCFLKQGLGWTENTTLFSGMGTDQNTAPALVDIDADGDLDLVLGDYDGTFTYYRNLMYSNAVLNPPTQLSADIASEVIVLWSTPVAGSTSPFLHYNVYLDGELAGTTSELSWIFTGLSVGNSYSVAITAEYIAGESVPAQIQITILGSEDPLQQPSLSGNWPNPFNPGTHIMFSLPKTDIAELVIYNSKGQRVKNLLQSQSLASGEHTVYWDGCDDAGNAVSSGVYLYRLQTSKLSTTRKMTLLK